MKRKILSIGLSLAMLISLSGCGVTDTGGEDEKVFRFSTLTEPTTIDPHEGNGEWMTNVTSSISEGLVRRYNGEIIPGVAESWEVSEDELVYTFKLRESSWSNGDKLVAQDFVDSWVLLYETATPMIQFVEHFLNEDGELMVKALDETTLEVTLNKPVPFIMEYFASPVLSPVKVDAFEGNQELYYQGVPTAVNGPFELVEWSPNNVMVMEPNEDYWNADAVKLDRVEIYTVKDEQTQINMYENDEIDMVDVASSMFSEFESQGMKYYEDGGITFLQIPKQGSSEESAKFLRNRDFVEALSYSIDRQLFVDSVFSGAYEPATEYVPQTSTGYVGGAKSDSTQEIKTPYIASADLEKAEASLQKALDELGYTKETMPEFTLLVSDGGTRQTEAQYIQDAASKIGVTINIETVPSATFWALVMEGHPHDFSIGGFGPDFEDATSFLLSYTSTGGYSVPFLGWSSEEYDQMFVDSWAAQGDERSNILAEMEEYLLFEGPTIPLYTSKAAWMLDESFSNISKNTTGTANDFVFADKE